jgi:DNA polymerase (family 10)
MHLKVIDSLDSRRLLGLDVFAWVTGIMLGALILNKFGHPGIVPRRVLLLAGLAGLCQVTVGVIHGLYTDRRRYQTLLNEIIIVAQTVAATATVLVVFDLWIVPQLAPISIVIGGALLALGPMGAARSFQSFNTKARKRWQPEKRARIPLERALVVAEQILSELDACDAVLRCSCVGSLRRMCDTVGDIDLVAASEYPDEVLKAFLSLQHAHRILKNPKAGATKAAIANAEGIQIELTVVSPGAYAAALVSKSGTKAHNIRVRKIALWRGYRFAWRPRRVVEYWLCLLTTGARAFTEREETEENIYQRLGMQWIPPPLREDRGEIEAALKGRLPRVVELTDVRGDLHDCSFGSYGNVREMINAANKRGYEYCAVLDRMRGFRESAYQLASIVRQRDDIRALNTSLKGQMEVFYGGELELGGDAQVACPDEILSSFDLVIATIRHDSCESRNLCHLLLKAIEHPRVHIIGHRSVCGISKQGFDDVCRAASHHQVALEISARPNMLGLPEEYLRRARDHGVRFIVSTSARSPSELILMRLGIAKAQRVWATAEDVINAWPLKRLKQFISKVNSSGISSISSTQIAHPGDTSLGDVSKTRTP